MNQKNLRGKTVEEIGTVTEITRYILKHHKETRGNDRILIVFVEEFCKEKGLKIPASETITRCRRKVQYNEMLYLPEKEVLEERRQRAGEFEELFSR